MIAVWIVLGIAAYLAGIGMAVGPARRHVYRGRYADTEFSVFMISVFWLLVLPYAVGKKIAKGFDAGERLAKKRRLELEAAKHETDLAKQRRIAAEELQRELRTLGKES